MNSYDDVLDSYTESKERLYHLTNVADRGLQCLMDFGIITVLTVIIANVIDQNFSNLKPNLPPYSFQLLWLGIYSIYYFSFEYFANSTVGKFVRRTRVFADNELKPTILQVLIRLVTRLIPFGFLMLLTSYQVTLHDFLSNTWLMKKIRDTDYTTRRYPRQLKPRNFRK